MSFLRTHDVVINYKLGSKVVKVVNKVNLSVNKGDYLCIIGSNGSGKSSLMKAVLGLVPIASGSVDFKISKDKISYLPQINSISSDFPATVCEIVLSGIQNPFKLFSFYSNNDHKKAKETLKLVELLEVKDRKFSELSVGQQQRVLLARSLVKDPQLIFLDEPCSGLDESITDQFYKILEDLNKNKKVSIVMISHDSSQVERYATHVLHLGKEALFYGTINKWLSTSKNVKCIH